MAETTEKKIRNREKSLIAEALRVEQANARCDTAKQKTRGDVSGGGKKPWRQKGTGRARQGSTRAPHWVGGGRAFNTTLENHHLKMNKKTRRNALIMLLQWKKENGRIVVDALEFDSPSTKQFKQFVADKNLVGKVLLLHSGASDNAVKSARNLPNVTIIHADSLNIQILLETEWLVTVPDVAGRLNIA